MANATDRRCAVVYNPTKVSDAFRGLITERLGPAGWSEPLWLETAEDDPGHSMTEKAVAEQVDRVIAAGGDGTVRIVADGLAGTGIPLGIVPAGTGNLLARNLKIPLGEAEAIDVALADQTRTIDLIEVSVDNRSSEHFAVMAGSGIDAVIMDETNPKLKAKIGSAAYFVAAARAVGRLPMEMTIQLDDNKVHKRRAMICLVGNVSDLTGNITLIPGARYDDGYLNVYVASPHRFTHWVRVLIRLVTRRGRDDDRVELHHGAGVLGAGRPRRRCRARHGHGQSFS